jgi:PAS domain S-box-containing protein
MSDLMINTIPPAFTSIHGLSNSNWLSLIVAHLPQAVLLEDDHRNIILVNQQFCKLFDLKMKPEQLVGQNTVELSAELNSYFENPSQFIQRMMAICSDKKASCNELIHLTDERILSRDYSPIWQDGTFAAHMWMFSDETDRLKEEHSIAEQRDFFEDVLNNIPSDIAVFSPEHKYLFINPVGVKDGELRKWLIGKSDVDYCLLRGKDMAIAEKRRKLFKQITETRKEVSWEEKLTTREGNIEYHLRNMSPLYDEKGGLKLLIGYGMNITERKQIEEKIQLSEKRYKDLFNYSQAMIGTHDLEGNILAVNPSFIETFGYTEEEVVGKNLKDFMMPEDQAAFGEMYLNSIHTNEKVKGLFRILNKSGKRVYLLYQNYKVSESSDADAYVIAFAQDVTDRIKIEKQLKEAKKITDETSKTKERFLANMSHEIRTPMNGIIGITSFLQKTELNEEQKNYLNIIDESAHDLLMIINDILDLEKVGTGNIQLEKIPFDVIAKTKTILKLFELNAMNKNVHIQFNNELGDNLCVAGDPTRFNQVMNNLISNAVKFTHEGKVIVQAVAEKETEDTITIKYSVQDTGIGIDEDKLVKIFQPFTQAYPETTRKYGGTGLGLAITKNLVELHGGAIWVESKPRKGSTFYFTIPYSKCKEGQKQMLEKTNPIQNQLGQLNVLLAEDNEVNQLLSTSMLQHWGFTTKVACTGLEVMEYINNETFDIILMDIQMPEMNGYEATKAIRSHSDSKKRNTPIIALTANALKSEEAKYEAAGMNGFLTKPFRETDLYNAICNALNNKNNFGNTESIDEPKQEVMALPEPTEKLYNLQLVSELARGNQEFITNLAQIFIDTVPVTSKEMVEACKLQNWEQAGKFAHKLKSTIDTMCINSIKEDVRTIEANGKNQADVANIPALVKKVDYVISQVTEQLKAEFKL